MDTAIDAARRMDRLYRYQRYVYDLTRRFFLLGRDQLIHGLRPAAGAAVLEIGCGTGRNLVKAARLWPQARFFGIDISREMLKSCQQSVTRAGYDGRIAVSCADATGFDPAALFGQERFDRIFISYSLSMIPLWRAVLDDAVRHLAAGGELHLVDFGGQAGLPKGFRAVLRRWLDWFHVTPRDDMEEALRTLAASAGLRLGMRRLYRDYAQYAVLKAPN